MKTSNSRGPKYGRIEVPNDPALASVRPLQQNDPSENPGVIKTFIFADRTPSMNHFEITAETASEAIRDLVAKHGEQPYRVVNVIEEVSS